MNGIQESKAKIILNKYTAVSKVAMEYNIVRAMNEYARIYHKEKLEQESLQKDVELLLKYYFDKYKYRYFRSFTGYISKSVLNLIKGSKKTTDLIIKIKQNDSSKIKD